MTIGIEDLTSNVQTDDANIVTGDGVFDDLMETVTVHLTAQYNLGWITGTDYATVYLSALQTTLQQSVGFLIGKEKNNAELDLLAQKEITEWAQTQQSSKIAPTSDSILGTQSTLTAEQAKGFKWNADQRYLKTILDAWSINTSTAGIPATGVNAINEVGEDNINDQIANAEPQD